MVTLNTVISKTLSILTGDETEIELELQLLDEIPDIYSNVKCLVRDLYRALGNLFGEVRKHGGGSRRRIKTSLDGDKQILELAWDGEPISEDKLKRIKELYQKGVLSKSEPRPSGAEMIGYFFNKYRGTVIIENFSDKTYTVRNVVSLPINYR